MNQFDLIAAIAATGSAAIFIVILGGGLAGDGSRLRAYLGYTLWFALIVALGATGALGAPGIGIAVAVPILLIAVFAWRRLVAIPTTTLIALNAMRILGVIFIILYANGRLPAPFAPSAGWGDIITGVAALPVAWATYRAIPGWRALALIWNLFGTLDLVAAIGFGVTSAEGSPIRVFFTEPGTAIMGTLPWILIPAFLVPSVMLTHIAIFRHLAEGRAVNGARPALA